MKLRTKINLVFLMIILFGVLVAVTTPILFNNIITTSLIERQKETTGQIIVNEIVTNLKKEDFESHEYVEKQKVFSELVNRLKISEIKAINLWNKDSTIIYSSESYFVGLNPENPRFQQAIRGVTVAEIDPVVDPGFPTHLYGKTRLMEMYVPIKFDSDIVGVAEIYVSLEALDEDISEINKVVNGIAMIFLTLGIIIIVIVNLIIRRSVVNPLDKFSRVIEKTSNGHKQINITGSDEIDILTRSFNVMIDDLEKSKKEIIKNERLTTIGELSASIAHNLKNPLAVILNRSQLVKLENPDLDEKTLRHLDAINRAVHKMDFEVEQVLEYVRHRPLSLKESILTDVIHSSFDRITIPDTVKITIQNNDMSLVCDPLKLEIVFANLIMNSIQAMNGVGEIQIRIFDQDDNVVIEVEDSGPGIITDTLPLIFEPLYTTKLNGTGLGLSTCKNIVESHGGQISAKNNPTIFTIRLPKNAQNGKND